MRKPNTKNRKRIPGIPQKDLRGRQSVRATFKLSQRAVETLSIVSVHLGIKQKSLFDHLLEDAGSLGLLARDLGPDKMEWPNRIQKTYVMSRKTLSCLEKTAQEFNAPRDALVEMSVQRLMPIIQKEQEKQQMRKGLLKEFGDFVDRGQRVLEKTRRALGKDDPVYEKLEPAIKALSSTCQSIETFVEKGKIIEDF